MLKIVTTRKSARNGRGNVLATTTVDGKRRQATVPWDHSKGTNANHGAAAGVLAKKVKPLWKVEEVADARHESSEDGNRHTFTI